ncbi:hypothetical protein OESDEN_14487, partial [Oesophagostomum dentatum]
MSDYIYSFSSYRNFLYFPYPGILAQNQNLPHVIPIRRSSPQLLGSFPVSQVENRENGSMLNPQAAVAFDGSSMKFTVISDKNLLERANEGMTLDQGGRDLTVLKLCSTVQEAEEA